jgi:hypothetical protein
MNDTAGATSPHGLSSAEVERGIWYSLTDTLLLDLVLLPQLLVLIVQEDSLEDVVLEWLGLVELILESRAIEAHFLKASALWNTM